MIKNNSKFTTNAKVMLSPQIHNMVYIFLDEVDEQNGSQTIEESGLNVKQELEPLSATVNGEKVQMIQLEKLID